MKKEVTFFKQNGKWYADIPEHTLEDNEMVMGSDILLEMLSNDGEFDILKLTFEDKDSEYHHLLAFKMVEHDDDGAYYTLSGPLYNIYLDSVYSENDVILNTVWICNVTHDVFGEHPKELYLTDMLQEKSMITEEELHKEYNREQCVYGKDSTMTCMFCSATCKERYEDFSKKGVKFTFLPV